MKVLFAIVMLLPALLMAGERPNVVVILTDDQGWGDLSIHGNRDIATPNLDRIASEGAVFDRFFVQPVCAPTRAEFLTGRFFSRTGVRGVSTGDERMDVGERTIAEVFKEAGYATAAFGKWHNGSQPPYHPNDRGFTEYVGFTSGHWGDYFSPVLERNGKLIRGEGYITDYLTDQALAFIEARKGGPFFCYLPLCTPHSPMQVPDRFWGRFEGKELGMMKGTKGLDDSAHTRAALAMVENIDGNVGRLLDRLDALGLAENTIVVYFSDNGPNGRRWNGGMKGIKGSVLEGGVRVPCFVRWPGRIKAGTEVERIAGGVDLLPTLAAAAGLKVDAPKALDGRNLLPLLEGKAETWGERFLMTVHGNGKRMQWSVRSQDLRLVNGETMYDPAKDPGHTKDVSAAHAGERKRMEAFAQGYLKEVAGNLEKDERPFTVGYGAVTWLPARDGIVVGGIQRSGRAPNCSFFTNWKKKEDRIKWRVAVGAAGTYEAILHYTCAAADLGSVIELRMGGSKEPYVFRDGDEARSSELQFGGVKVRATISVAFDPPLVGDEHDRSGRGGAESFVKDFKPMSLGRMELKVGEGVIELRAAEIPAGGVADVRWLELRRVDAGDLR